MKGHGQHLPLPRRMVYTLSTWSAYTTIILFISWLIHLPALITLGVLGTKAAITTGMHSGLHVKSYRKSHPDFRPTHREFLIVLGVLWAFIIATGVGFMALKGG